MKIICVVAVLITSIILCVQNMNNWPKDNYMLISTDTSCPTGFESNHKFMFFNTIGKHSIPDKVKTEVKGTNVQFEVCKMLQEKTTSVEEGEETKAKEESSKNEDWHAGQYCIIKESTKACPDKFTQVIISISETPLSIPVSTANQINELETPIKPTTNVPNHESNSQPNNESDLHSEAIPSTKPSSQAQPTSLPQPELKSQPSESEPVASSIILPTVVKPGIYSTEKVPIVTIQPVRTNPQPTNKAVLSESNVISSQKLVDSRQVMENNNPVEVSVVGSQNEFITAFCCMNQTNDKMLKFPKESSFILVKYGLKCPEVEGMLDKELFYTFSAKKSIYVTVEPKSDSTFLITVINQTETKFNFCYYAVNSTLTPMSQTMTISIAIIAGVIALILLTAIILMVTKSSK